MRHVGKRIGPAGGVRALPGGVAYIDRSGRRITRAELARDAERGLKFFQRNHVPGVRRRSRSQEVAA